MELERMLGGILRMLTDGVLVTDNQGRVVLLNRAAEQLTGWTTKETAGKMADLFFRVVDRPSREPLVSPMSRVIRTGLEIGLTTDCQLLQRNGEVLDIALSAAPVLDERGELEGVVVIFRDDSMRRQLQREQIRSERQESLSLMAGGLAHDFNNLLSGVLGNISLAREEAPPGEWRHYLEAADHAGRRAQTLSRQLLAFSQGHAPVVGPAATRELLEETVSFSLAGSRLDLTMELEENLWPCRVDEGRIAQALNNLLINAKQAMPGGGRMAVRACNVELGRQKGIPLPPGYYVRIDLEDTGSGIAPEHLSRIFDPYFTTKPEGSGLGLANCRAIMREHGGHITVESEVGKGTCISLYLPADPEDKTPDRVEEPEEAILYRGEGRVLVMDDERLVQQITGDILGHLGFEADFAANGHEALQRVEETRQSGSPFRAIILDLTVPGSMGGLETMKQLELLAPGVPVIVSSGYANDPAMLHHREHGFSAMVSKPYTIRHMSRVLRKVLEVG